MYVETSPHIPQAVPSCRLWSARHWHRHRWEQQQQEEKGRERQLQVLAIAHQRRATGTVSVCRPLGVHAFATLATLAQPAPSALLGEKITLHAQQ